MYGRRGMAPCAWFLVYHVIVLTSHKDKGGLRPLVESNYDTHQFHEFFENWVDLQFKVRISAKLN